MSRVIPPAFFSALLCGWLAATSPVRGAEAVPGAWELVARHLPGDALARLKSSPAASDRESAFARAVILMDSQPVTDARLTDVVAQLSALAAGDDEIASASAYLVGRVYQVHFFQADNVRAARAFEELAAKRPGSYWGQLALVKLAALKLYALPEPAEPTARVAAAEALLERVTVPELQRDLHLLIGRARLFHRMPGVLPHLLAAAQIGGLAGIPRGDLALQIGELSMRAGQYGQAKVFFGQFLEENEVDGRVYAVRMRLEELAAKTSAEKAAP